MVTKSLLLLPVNSYVTSFILAKMNVCVCQGGGTCMFCMFACLCGHTGRMSKEDLAVVDKPARECAVFLQEFSIHAECLTHPLQCPLPGRQRREQRPITIRNLLLLSSERRQPSFLCAYSHLYRDRSRVRLFCLENVYLCLRFLPKDMEKPLLQVMTVEPQHIIHFLSFNLVVSMGKFFWSTHPAVKHGHYSIMWELHLKWFEAVVFKGSI